MLTAEFLPISLLTPMAYGLGISTGLAGQSMSAVAFAAMISGLFITTLARDIDRRSLFLGFTTALAVSCAIVAVSPTFSGILAGRFLLGLALGAFWAMSTSLVMRLARPEDISKALSAVFAGVSVSMVIAAPAGSLLERSVGWRGVFAIAAALGIGCTLWQHISLPSLPASDRRSTIVDVLRLLGRPGIAMAMVAMSSVFAGQFAFFTFVRPLYEVRGEVGASEISTMFIILGLSNLAGTSMCSFVLRSRLRASLLIAPIIMALAGLSALSAQSAPVALISISVWGLSMGCVPVSWSTWVAAYLSDDVENAGGLQIALIQIANVTGASVGGLTYDSIGVAGPVLTSVAFLASGAIFALISLSRVRNMAAAKATPPLRRCE
jgi:MFS transporter, DHA1 family, purine ribonucleoside efflux pump